MSDKFYDFIAGRIYDYFNKLSDQGLLNNGETFLLKVDESSDDDMAKGIYEALHDLLQSQNNIGNFSFVCMDQTVYKTYTLRVKNNIEVVVAAQIDGMTGSFLGASIRNEVNLRKLPLLMISPRPNDSAKSGARDMAAAGMPFNYRELIRTIKDRIKDDSSLKLTDRMVLEFELDSREADVFSDKTSLYEYKEFLSILAEGHIDDNIFPSFRLFKIDRNKDFAGEDEKAVLGYIKENRKWFDEIDRSVKYGDPMTDLASDYGENFAKLVNDARNEDPDNWSLNIKDADVRKAREEKISNRENPIALEEVYAYRETEEDRFEKNKFFFIREYASTKANKKYNILIFNPEHYPLIAFKIILNKKLKKTIKAECNSLDAPIKKNKSLIYSIPSQEKAFHRIEITEDKRHLQFKICLLNISPDFLMPTIQTSFVVNAKKKSSNEKIELLGVDSQLKFNDHHFPVVKKLIEDDGEYALDRETCLCLSLSEDEGAYATGKINITLKVADITIPVTLIVDQDKITVATGRRILQEKLMAKESFIMTGPDRIQQSSQEYYVLENLGNELNFEKQIVEKKICFGKLTKDVNGEYEVKPIDISLSDNLRNAYIELLDAMAVINTLPSLAYLGLGDNGSENSLHEKAVAYLKTFQDEFCDTDGKRIKDHDLLTKEQQDALKLGMIIVGDEENEIYLSPLHPINVAYQLSLLKEKGIESASDIILDRLNSIYLLPYIRYRKKVYKVSDQLFSMEWRHYAPIENKKYMGGRNFVPKLVEDKIKEFTGNFNYIFGETNNKVLRINLIDMGDCSEVLQGIAQYYCHKINEDPDVEKLMKLRINIYTNDIRANCFNYLKHMYQLREFLKESKLSIEAGIAMNDLEGILSRNVKCFFKEDNNEYDYAHITFYEMESEIDSESSMMNQIPTGLSLGGIISGVPSTKLGQKYRTGFGKKYVKHTDLEEFASFYNSLCLVGDTGNPFQEGAGISTEISEVAENKMSSIYSKSNWVVFVDPKVDLNFFCEKEAQGEFLIIHYSDQYTSSAAYDAITVTHKSDQYEKLIANYLYTRELHPSIDDINNIIYLFNAVNGDWLLKLISSKKANRKARQSNFSREKISIVAAIKLMMAYLKQRQKMMLWVPISLEEILRVSGGVGLSRHDGLLSAQNLGFDKGPTSDDLLFVGLNEEDGKLKVLLYPVEVKTGVTASDQSILSKAYEQVEKTAKGLAESLNPEDVDALNTITYKVNRNFLMQIVINSCIKMNIYNIDDSQNWSECLDRFSERLLNEEYEIIREAQPKIGRAAVLSFSQQYLKIWNSVFEHGDIEKIEIPEDDEKNLILESVSDIENESNLKELAKDTNELKIGCGNDDKSMNAGETDAEAEPETDTAEENLPESDDTDKKAEPAKPSEEMTEKTAEKPEIFEKVGIHVKLGTDIKTGMPTEWEPNNTNQLFHTNMGIIGTMGTGKTQFTKSLVTQIYKQTKYNIDNGPIGILIFDYKGDYNETKADFVEATNAKIYKLYHLSYNPFSLTLTNGQLPLLPVHTASIFRDTLTKAYGLGPKQGSALQSCIIEAYHRQGIIEDKPETWSNPAPTFETVYRVYEENDDIKKNDSLNAAMEELHSFQVFEPDPHKVKSLFSELNGVMVVDLNGFSDELQSLVVAITLDLFYSQMQKAGSSKLMKQYRQVTKFILVDEADNFMSKGFPSLKKIMKEGREFGVGVILSTQFLDHFYASDEDYSKYILTWVVHNVADLKPVDVDEVFRTQPKSDEEKMIFNDIKALKKHNSIIKIGTNKPIYINDYPFWKLVNDLKRSETDKQQ